MDRSELLERRRGLYWLSSIVSVVLGSILLLAAYGKWFYPADLLKTWDRSIAVFEAVIVFGIWFFRFSPVLWLLTAVLFSTWGGYAWFWYQLELPCYCLGKALQIPTLLSLSLDGVFVVLSWGLAFLLQASAWMFYVDFFLASSGALVVFFLANKIYHLFVLPLT